VSFRRSARTGARSKWPKSIWSSSRFQFFPDIDTRSLVRHVRDHGVMRGVISTLESDADKLIAKARSIPKMDGTDLAKVVSTKRSYAVGKWASASHEPVAVVGSRTSLRGFM